MELIDIEMLRFESRNEAMFLVDRIFEFGEISVYDYWVLSGGKGERLERNYVNEMTAAYLEEQIDGVVRYRDGYGIVLKKEKK